MFTYNLHWHAKRSIILYPKVNQDDSEFGVYHHNGRQCKLGFIDLIEGDNLKPNSLIAAEVFEKFKYMVS